MQYSRLPVTFLSSACPVVLVALSRQHSNELLLCEHMVPMLRRTFPAVAAVALQSDALSAEPSSCLKSLPLIQCLSYDGDSIPPSILPVLANLLHACASSKHQHTPTLPLASPQFFTAASPVASPPRLQSFSVPISPAALSASPPSPGATLGLSLKWGAGGLAVHAIAQHSLAAASCCFQVGDIILNVDGIDVTSSRDARHAAIARLRQACDVPVQVCTRAGAGWHGDGSRAFGSTTLFQLSSVAASPPKQAAPALAGAAQSNDPNQLFAQAKQFHSSGNSVAAATHLLNAARRNHPPACAMLASFYLCGCGGLPQNNHLAFSLARWSTLQKDADGMGVLACCFLFGLGTNQDFALSYTLAAGCADDSPHGQFGLGYMYLHGLGVHKDVQLAERCRRLLL